ncbi:TIR domain-containing protein [Candidatus Poriferisodalis sp.]|uniref:TIR domain-containing protein n=1 Tax=Candidatus Poriferisodalis sp. TaxID=3101277 RepID=UPI003B51BE37
MAYRNVFFSFGWDDDVWRAMVVRNCGLTLGVNAAGFKDAADIEAVKRQSDAAIQRWIDAQLVGTTVTVVLLGATTFASRWVKYEFEASMARGNGVVFIDISGIADQDGRTTTFGGLPAGWTLVEHGSHPQYLFRVWDTQTSPQHIGDWIELAARNVGI